MLLADPNLALRRLIMTDPKLPVFKNGKTLGTSDHTAINETMSDACKESFEVQESITFCVPTLFLDEEKAHVEKCASCFKDDYYIHLQKIYACPHICYFGNLEVTSVSQFLYSVYSHILYIMCPLRGWTIHSHVLSIMSSLQRGNIFLLFSLSWTVHWRSITKHLKLLAKGPTIYFFNFFVLNCFLLNVKSIILSY